MPINIQTKIICFAYIAFFEMDIIYLVNMWNVGHVIGRIRTCWIIVPSDSLALFVKKVQRNTFLYLFEYQVNTFRFKLYNVVSKLNLMIYYLIEYYDLWFNRLYFCQFNILCGVVFRSSQNSSALGYGKLKCYHSTIILNLTTIDT